MADAKTITTKAEGKGEEVIDLTEKQTVYATEKAPHHQEGEEMIVHPKIADQFIKKGFATEAAPKKKGDKE